MSTVKLNCKYGVLPNGDIIEKLPFRDVLLPIPEKCEKTFLGWSETQFPDVLRTNFNEDRNAEFTAVFTDEPAYILQTHFRGDVNDYTGARCHYRRYVLDVYTENSDAESGTFKLNTDNGFLYYLGYVPTDGVILSVDAPVTRFEGSNWDTADDYRTKYVRVNWKCEKAQKSGSGRRKIARIMFYFSRFGIGYSEIVSRPASSILFADKDYVQKIGENSAKISTNLYFGPMDEKTSSKEDFEDFFIKPSADTAPEENVISRFAVMSDSHVGVRYAWENYGWLDNAFRGIEEVHSKTPLDFVVQLGDNIDDGYAETYKTDYALYLEKIKGLKICDAQNPVENRALGTVPHYEMQGNHDTSPDTRFFRNKMWFTENTDKKRVYYIAFFANYGGYPLVKYPITGDYKTYRSYGIISDETVEFVQKSVDEAVKNSAVHIVLLCHFGISEKLFAPILPETGLGKIALICKKHNIKLYFNGHEHNADYSLYNFNGIYNYDAAMTSDSYAVVEIKSNSATVRIYNSLDNSLKRTDELPL